MMAAITKNTTLKNWQTPIRKSHMEVETKEDRMEGIIHTHILTQIRGCPENPKITGNKIPVKNSRMNTR
jgi:hypothetical protein